MESQSGAEISISDSQYQTLTSGLLFVLSLTYLKRQNGEGAIHNTLNFLKER